MGSMSTFIAKVEEALAADGVGVTVVSKFGLEYLEQRDKLTPSIVWVPTEESFGDPMANATALVGPKSAKTLNAGLVLHLWAKGSDSDSSDYRELNAIEAFRDRVIWALKKAYQGGFALKGGKHQEASHNLYGRGYELSISVVLPVIQPVAEATITTFTNVTGFQSTAVFPGSEVTGVPAP